MQNLYRVEALPPTIVIGVQTEEGVCAIDFDCTAWLAWWPDMTLSAVHTRPGETASYPVETERNGTVLRWKVSAVDTEIAGQGVIEIIGVSQGKRKLSGKTCTHIEETSTTETTEPPEAMQPYIQRVQEAAKRAEDAADDAAASTAAAGAAAARAEAAAARAEKAADSSSGSSGSTITEDTIPSYWLTHLQERVPTIRAAMAAAGWDKSAFLWYHDVHWTYGYKRAPMLLKYLYQHTPINKTICGGDIVDAEGDDTTMAYLWDWREAVRGLPNHHSVPGNHDDGNSTDNRWDDPYIYAYLLAAEETHDVVRGDAGLYYYIDDQAEKTRYLYLDTATKDGNIINDTAEQTWLKATLISTPAGWHIVAVAHIWRTVDYGVTPPQDDGWSWGGAHCLGEFDKYNARSGDYAGCGGKVEFCLGGHTHVDADFVSDGGIPVILTECDSRYVRSGLSCKEGTITEASVNAIVADYGSGVVNVIRIGRGSSRVVKLDGSGSTEPEVPEEPDVPVVPEGDFTNTLTEAGYTEGMRYSSDTGGGTDVEAPGWDITGYIAAKRGDTVYMANVNFLDFDGGGGADSRAMVYLYDANKTYVVCSANYTPDSLMSDAWSAVYGEDGDLIQFTIPTSYSSSVAYIRIGARNIDQYSVITVNEPIE